MFTVKLVSSSHTYIRSAARVTIRQLRPNFPEKEIILHTGEDDFHFNVGGDNDFCRAYVENANGKTTEVI